LTDREGRILDRRAVGSWVQFFHGVLEPLGCCELGTLEVNAPIAPFCESYLLHESGFLFYEKIGASHCERPASIATFYNKLLVVFTASPAVECAVSCCRCFPALPSITQQDSNIDTEAASLERGRGIQPRFGSVGCGCRSCCRIACAPPPRPCRCARWRDGSVAMPVSRLLAYRLGTNAMLMKRIVSVWNHRAGNQFQRCLPPKCCWSCLRTPGSWQPLCSSS
jgi:hypothetical protein